MKKMLKEFVVGKNTQTNGIFALFIIALIALGCTCNKNFDFANSGKNESDNRAVSNTETNTGTSTDDDSLTPPATRADASKGEVPTESESQYMAKKTLLDFNEAIQKADFTDFHGNISRTWQKQISAEKFKQEFQAFIDKGVDISEIKSKKAEFSPSPGIETVGRMKMLVMKGSYDIRPVPTIFELKYIPDGDDWKLFGIDVRTKSFK